MRVNPEGPQFYRKAGPPEDGGQEEPTKENKPRILQVLPGTRRGALLRGKFIGARKHRLIKKLRF